eukprot:3384273-Amphidinium_carterae.1
MTRLRDRNLASRFKDDCQRMPLHVSAAAVLTLAYVTDSSKSLGCLSSALRNRCSKPKGDKVITISRINP